MRPTSIMKIITNEDKVLTIGVLFIINFKLKVRKYLSNR